MKHDIIYGVYGEQEKTLVFIARRRALELRALWAAIFAAKTWSAFAKSVNASTYREAIVALAGGNLDVDAHVPFNFEEASSEVEWPTNPMDDMEQLLPLEVIALSRPIRLGQFRMFDVKRKFEIVTVLQNLGWQLERDDELVRAACGNWRI